MNEGRKQGMSGTGNRPKNRRKKKKKQTKKKKTKKRKENIFKYVHKEFSLSGTVMK
jgi:hypothetical protein